MAKDRQAKARKGQPLSKTAKAELPAVPAQQQTPLFCFCYADTSTRNAWKFEPDADEAPGLFDFLTKIGRSTWSEIERMQTGVRNRHRKHHSLPIASIESAAISDIRNRKLDETFGDSIFRFRVSGEKRLWGFRRDRTFHVVWWDPHHKVYETDA
jgi:hypothetical protein